MENANLLLFRQIDSKYLFYYLGAPSIEVMSFLPSEWKIESVKLMASNLVDIIYPQNIKGLSTLAGLVDYFEENSDYSLDSLDMILENHVEIHVHDNFEINIRTERYDTLLEIMLLVLNAQGYNATEVIVMLEENEGQFLHVEQPNIVVEKFETFDLYLAKT